MNRYLSPARRTAVRLRWTAALPAMLALAGCLSFGGKPPKQLIRLSPETAQLVGASVTSPIGAAIVVAEPDADPSLATNRVPVQISDTAIAYLVGATWLTRPTREFRALLADTLRARGKALVFEDNALGASGRVHLTGRLDRMAMIRPAAASLFASTPSVRPRGSRPSPSCSRPVSPPSPPRPMPWSRRSTMPRTMSRGRSPIGLAARAGTPMPLIQPLRATAIALTLAAPLSGCIMAARHVAREVNRSDAQARARRDFPPGQSPDRIRTAMTAKGYACADLPVADPRGFRLDCRVVSPHKTAGTFLVGGNWRLEFSGYDGRLVQVHASGRKRASTASAAASRPPPAASRPPGA